MATATLSSQLTDVSLDPGAPTGVGTSNAEQSETAIQLQGANCAAMGHSGSVGPAAPSAISEFRGGYVTVTGFTRTDMHLHLWMRDLYPIRDVEVGGVSAYIFGSSEAIYYATGLNKGYGGGWFHFVLNLDAGDRPAASLGTAPSANITRVGYCGNISATKGEDFLQNSYFDAIRRGTAGQGNTFSGGVTGDRLTFFNCADADAASYAMLRNVGGALFVEGPVTLGGAGLTTWLEDSLNTLNFTEFSVNNGTNGLTRVSATAFDYYRFTLADGTTGVTQVHLSDYTFKGGPFATFIFDATALAAGDADSSLRNSYVLFWSVDFGAQCTSTDDNFIGGASSSVDPDGITLNGPKFSSVTTVNLLTAGSAVDGGSTNGHNTAINVPYMFCSDLADIANHAFDNTGGLGHAIHINTPGTYSFVGNTFTGYGGTPGSNLVANTGDSSAAIINGSGGLVTINISGGGNSPSIRNGAGATTAVVLAIDYEMTGLDAGAEVTIVDITTPATPVELLNEVAGIDGIVTYSFDGALTGTAIGVYIRNTTIENVEFDDVLPAADTSFPVPQPADTVYLP